MSMGSPWHGGLESRMDLGRDCGVGPQSLKPLCKPLEQESIDYGSQKREDPTHRHPQAPGGGACREARSRQEADRSDAQDRKSTRLNSSHIPLSRMPSS